jgi:hypothetical protein
MTTTITSLDRDTVEDIKDALEYVIETSKHDTSRFVTARKLLDDGDVTLVADGPAMATGGPKIQPETAVLALRQALAAAQAATTAALGHLSTTSAMRRSELAGLVDDVDKTVAQITAILGHLEENIADWLPDGEATLSEALGALDHAGTQLHEIHTGLASR